MVSANIIQLENILNFGFLKRTWMIVFEILESLGIIIASGVAVWGIYSWRREAKWKRKYQLAEEVLTNLYESHQAIRTIRNPVGFGNEGSSRTKNKNETLKQTKIFNQAYVTRERYERNKTPLEKLHALKFRFTALYGKDSEKYFDTFSQTLNNIFFASDEIARVHLGEYGEDKTLIRDTMRACRRVLYAAFKDEDEIENDLKIAISGIENKCREIIGNYK